MAKKRTGQDGETMKAYSALQKILTAVEQNHSKLRAEPDSDGTVHDKWEEEDDALTDLEEALSEAISSYELAMEVRKSLKTAVITT